MGERDQLKRFSCSFLLKENESFRRINDSQKQQHFYLCTINDMHGNVRLCLQLTHIYLINVVVVDFVVFFSTSLFLFSSLSLLPAPVVLMRFLFALFVCIDGVSALFGTLNTRLRTHHWQCQHLTNIVNSISNSRCLHEIQIITHN